MTASTPHRCALYTRVSTTTRDADGDYRQSIELQETALREFAGRRGWEVVAHYTDRDSGANDRRRGLTTLMDEARRHRFDSVLVWRFDRFARSIGKAVLALDEFRALGIDFISATEAIDTTSPMGRAMFGIIAVFAEWEREVIRSRVLAGVATARAKGVKLGRPRRRVDPELVRMLQQDGLTLDEIAKRLKVGRATVYRALQNNKEEKPHVQRPIDQSGKEA